MSRICNMIIWGDKLPERIENGAEFQALPVEVQKEVFIDWRYCIDNGLIHGHGLVGHFNWMRFLVLEWESERGAPAEVPGVTVRTSQTRRTRPSR